MGKVSKISFFSKEKLKCPVCGTEFNKEEIYTGRGRLIAGELSDELRRSYEPSEKFGEVYPLIYFITVCPSCFYSTFPSDFNEIPEASISSVSRDMEKRFSSIGIIFNDLDFNKPRELKEGIASYHLSMMCYNLSPPDSIPTIKQGISALRCAWLLNDMHKKYPGKNYDYISGLLYRKAKFFYTLAVRYEEDGKENIGDIVNPGPDLDKNYGYEGILYISALLEYKYGQVKDKQKRLEALASAKRTVSRIFGMGQASKDKPSAMLENARDLFTKIGEDLLSEESDA